MSDSAEVVLTLSVLTCQAEQFMSDSAEILIFTQRNSLQRIAQLSDAFRQVATSNIFIRVYSPLERHMATPVYLKTRV
jgi:hypothetical protein